MLGEGILHLCGMGNGQFFWGFRGLMWDSRLLFLRDVSGRHLRLYWALVCVRNGRANGFPIKRRLCSFRTGVEADWK